MPAPRRALCAAALSTVVATVLPGILPAAEAAEPPPSGEVLTTFSPKYMDSSLGTKTVTRAKALADAANFDLLIPQEATYKGHVAAMRQVNPNLRLYVYMDAAFLKGADAPSAPAEWFARNAQGALIKHSKFDTYLMNPRTPGWIIQRQQFCLERLARSGYDGCYLDDMGSAPVSVPGYVTSYPVDPRTGRTFTGDDWMAATGELASALVAGVGPRLIVGNGVGTAGRYWGPDDASASLLSHAEAVMAEAWLRGSSDSLTKYPRIEIWRASVDMLADAGSRGQSILAVVKAWAAGTTAQKAAWHKFALATFLLGNDGRSRFFFTDAHAQDMTKVQPLWKTDLGAPTGPYVARADGSFSRDFATGKVLVNPSASRVSVALDSPMRTTSGTRTSRVTLRPNSAEILVS